MFILEGMKYFLGMVDRPTKQTPSLSLPPSISLSLSHRSLFPLPVFKIVFRILTPSALVTFGFSARILPPVERCGRWYGASVNDDDDDATMNTTPLRRR